MSRLIWLDRDSVEFPPIEQAMRSPDGLLAAGGDLRPERLERAYYEGIFPWYEEGGPLLWWSPDPRMVLTPEQARVTRSLARLLRKQRYRVTMDTAFDAVVHACAHPREHREGTWITDEMQVAYCDLHRQQKAHSVEVWEQDELVGGLYGVSMGPMFFGESMFNRRDNAAKVAFVALARQLQSWQFRLVDCQMPTAYLATLGATPMPRAEFKQLLWRYRDQPGRSGHWHFDLHPFLLDPFPPNNTPDDAQPLPIQHK